MKHKCNQLEKEKYADCFDCLVWHKSKNNSINIRWKCVNCGQYTASIPACPKCKKEK